MSAAIFTLFLISFAQESEAIKHDTDLGIAIVSGNARSESYSFKQMNSYEWYRNLIRLSGHYLLVRSNDLESSRNWDATLRYQRKLDEEFSLFVAESIEGDRFAGFDPRVNSDLGARYDWLKTEVWHSAVEAGYRNVQERRLAGDTVARNNARVYSELEKFWNTIVSSKLSAEYLVNVVESKDYRVNGEASVNCQLDKTFSLRTSYLVKYNNNPPPLVAQTTDTVFITSLAARY